MQVILKEDVLNLGYKDDVVTVKDGYGRNYLIPQGKAVIATPSALKMSFNNIQIAEALGKLGYEVDRKVIYIKDSVKEVGAYKATLRLHKEVSIDIPFEVVSE